MDNETTRELPTPQTADRDVESAAEDSLAALDAARDRIDELDRLGEDEEENQL